MVVNVNEVSALPREEREKLLEALMETTVPVDIPPLVENSSRAWSGRTVRSRSSLND